MLPSAASATTRAAPAPASATTPAAPAPAQLLTFNLLIEAIARNDLNAVNKLIPHIDVNWAGESGRTLLWVASREGHLEIVDRLLQVEGINVNRDNDSRITPLWIAANWGHLPVVDRLLRVQGIDANQVDTE